MVLEWIIGIIVVLIILMFVFYYNRFIRLENIISNSLSQIDVQLKKRADLVPNLLNSVKGYMKHEKSIMQDVTNARKALLGATSMTTKLKAGGELQHALKSIFAIAENYPQLRANEGFIQLQNELSGIEERIAYSRQHYNDSILSFNNSVETFPGVFFAKLFNKVEQKMLEIKPDESAV